MPHSLSSRPQRLLALTLLVVVATLAASCSSDNSKGSTTTAAKGSPATMAPLGEPVVGGSLTYGIEAESDDGWCLPKSQLAGSGIMVANTMFDSLFNYDENFVPQPYLAES